MPSHPADVRDRVRQVLLEDWDPSNAIRFEAAHGEYDSYLDPLISLARAGGGPQPIIDYLHDRELTTMCFPPAGTAHLRRVAQRIIRAVDAPAV
ncbi:MAG TPA: hypothetical protein VK324_01840 [Tepidisphaeraceae bacterium]|nr:hypothetical protein [Tepidisphaeraceae bacterium]